MGTIMLHVCMSNGFFEGSLRPSQELDLETLVSICVMESVTRYDDSAGPIFHHLKVKL